VLIRSFAAVLVDLVASAFQLDETLFRRSEERVPDPYKNK
jgi:hypothetical protein